MKALQHIGFFVFKCIVIVCLVLGVYQFTKTEIIRNIPLRELQNPLINCMDETAMEEGSSAKFRQLYGLNVNDYEEVLFYIPVSNMDVEELFLVKVKNNSQIEILQSAIESRIESQKTKFDGYGTNQMGLLERSEQHVMGKYVLFVVSEGASQVKEEFIKQLREGGNEK